jgi:hypothetical protein
MVLYLLETHIMGLAEDVPEQGPKHVAVSK